MQLARRQLHYAVMFFGPLAARHYWRITNGSKRLPLCDMLLSQIELVE